MKEHEKECEFAPVPCPHEACPHSKDKGNLLARSALKEHEPSCEYRTVKCPDGCGMAYLVGEKEAHIARCKHAPKPCPLGCGILVSGLQMSKHKKSVCPNAPQTCPVPGCEFTAGRGMEEEWSAHMTNFQVSHYKTMLDMLSDHTRMLEDYEKVINAQAGVIGDQAIRLRELEAFSDKVRTVEPFSELARSVTWTVDAFSDLYSQNIDIYSPELRFDCVEREHRYSFMLKLEFNANSHIGVMLVPREGVNSAQLEWPIKNTIIITVKSKTTSKHVNGNCDSPSFLEFYKSHAPPKADNLEAWGFPKFLKDKALATGDYTNNNTLTFHMTMLP